MKKYISLAVILCFAALCSLLAQDGTWKVLNSTDLMKEYNFNQVTFAPGLNYHQGYGSGFIFAENIDGTGAVLKTMDGGDTWAILKTINESYGGLTNGKMFGSIFYAWGKEKTLLKGESGGLIWSLLTLPETSESEILDAEFKSDGVTGIITDGKHIYYTSNGGTAWGESELPNGVTGISDLVYAGGNLFFAVGQKGQILKSTNSGYQWTVVNNSNTTINFTAAIFRDSDYGVFAGVSTVSPKKACIWLTTNGGLDIFEAQTIETTNTFKSFTSTNDGHLYTISDGGKLIRSIDEGLTWNNVTLDMPVDRTAKAFTITPHNVMYAVGELGLVEINAPKLKADFASYLPDNSKKNEFGFTNKSEGYISSIKWWFESANPSEGFGRDVSLVSFNKSGSWDVTLVVTGKCPGTTATVSDTIIKPIEAIADFDWELFVIGNYRNTRVVFPEGQNLIGFMTTSYMTTGQKGEIWKTTDGGNTWRCVLKSTDDLVVKGLEGLDFCNLQKGYACGFGASFTGKGGKDSQLWRTTDEGETWNLVDLSGVEGYGTEEYFANIVFSDENTGVLLYTTKVFYTEDGGTTWNLGKIKSNIWNGIRANMSLWDICSADDSTFYGVGKDNQVFKSDDGGKNWFLVYTAEQGAQQYYTSVGFRDANYGIVGPDDTSNGNVYLTTDGGTTWSEIPTKAYAIFNTVDFVNDTIVYIGGTTYSSTILKSIDGGLTWAEEKHPGIGEALNDISHSATGVVYATGSSGVFKRYIPEINAEFSFVQDDEKKNLDVEFRNGSFGFLTDYEWKVNGEVESTKFSPVITFPGAGIYQVTLTVSGNHPDKGLLSATVTKSIEIVGGSSIEDETLSGGDLNVFPNPVVDMLNYSFSLNKSANVKVDIMNVNGQTIATQQYASLEAGEYLYKVNAESWNKGVYLLQLVVDGSVVKTVKIIK